METSQALEERGQTHGHDGNALHVPHLVCALIEAGGLGATHHTGPLFEEPVGTNGGHEAGLAVEEVQGGGAGGRVKDAGLTNGLQLTSRGEGEGAGATGDTPRLELLCVGERRLQLSAHTTH